MGYGIALSGGGTRGAAHVGVMCALEEENLLPSAVAGTSAGSIVAGLYALGMPPSEMKKKVLELAGNGEAIVDADLPAVFGALIRLFGGKPMKLSGFLKGNKLESYLDDLTGRQNITALPMRTILTAVDLYSRKTVAYTNSTVGVRPVKGVVWKSDVGLSAAMRASCAVPAIFQPKLLDGMCLVDGGVTDVVPVDLLIAAGVEDVLAVDLSENDPMKPDGNILDVCNSALSILMNCLSVYRSGSEKLLLTPVLPAAAHVLTFNELVPCMEAGYRAAKDVMPIIRRRFAQ